MQPRDPRSIVSVLAKPAAYAQELAALYERHSRARRPWEQGGVALGELGPRVRSALAKELAKSVASGAYRFSPSEPRVARLGGKTRVIYRGSITDTVVVSVLAKVLRRLAEPLVSERVYSYRPGRSALQAARDFAAYVRAHRRARPDPRTRGLYVVRRDVARYGESIPVHEASPLWAQLDEVFARWSIAASEPIVTLVREAVRPLIAADGGEQRMELGVPTGSAIQPVICNLYLGPLDRALASVAGGFYSRFGDDILFAHPDAAVAARARAAAAQLVDALALGFKAEKSTDLCFNAAGRSAPSWRGSAFLDYLGLRLNFAGALGLPAAKARSLLRELTRRMENELRLATELGQEQALQLLCASARESLEVRSALVLPLAAFALHAVDDRAQLRHLDYLVARQASEALSGRRGVRAFRSVSYRSLRRAGLPSLVASRNQR